MTSELRTRIVNGALFGGLVLIFTVWSYWAFALMCAVGGSILAYEWWRLTKHRSLFIQLLGTPYIAAACMALVYLRICDLSILLSLFAIVWAGDIAAYFVGKRYGRHKIAPRISPGKSWEGLGASVVASMVIAASLGHVAPLPHALLGAVFAVVGLGGDLFESALKRHAGVKDSGTLIPGHGGLFDRVDALLPCAIIAAIALYMRLNMH